MKDLVFDVETNGFLRDLDRVHSLVFQTTDTGNFNSMKPDLVKDGVRALQDLHDDGYWLVGHNIIKFDLPAIKKVFPSFTWDETRVVDTLVLSSLLYPNLFDMDMARIRKGKLHFEDGKMIGRHRLEAWGIRLGILKGEYTTWKRAKLIEQDPGITEEEISKYLFAEWDPEMQDYCEQDVRVNVELWERCKKRIDRQPKHVIRTEHEIQFAVADMEQNGFPFDYEGGEKLAGVLYGDKAKIEARLKKIIHPWWIPNGPVQTVKKTMVGRKPTTATRFEGGKYTKIKLRTFNPGSRDQIADRMTKLFGWKPEEFTPSGKPKVDESTLKSLEGDVPKAVIEYLTIDKRLGALAEGDQAWLTSYDPRTKCIHGSINALGTVTRRASHSSPNLSQVAAVGKPYGAECRTLFRPFPDEVQLGCDVSGLELRMLGHYLAQWDGGAYAKEVVEGDVHWVNVQALFSLLNGVIRDDHIRLHKLARDGAKTWIYAFLYGSGNANLAMILLRTILKMVDEGVEGGQELIEEIFKGNRGPTEAQLRTIGGGIKKRFLAKLPALDKLIKAVKQEAADEGVVFTIDGGPIPIRSQHAALNSLLQSAGAVVCKRWIIEYRQRLLRESIWGKEYRSLLWSHDEIQGSVVPEAADYCGEVCVQTIEKVGQQLNLNVPLTGEYIIGANWKECH